MSEIGITPAIIWADQPEVVRLTAGRSVSVLLRESRRGGLTMYTRGDDPKRPRHFWVTSEVVSYFKATSKSNNAAQQEEHVQ